MYCYTVKEDYLPVVYLLSNPLFNVKIYKEHELNQSTVLETSDIYYFYFLDQELTFHFHNLYMYVSSFLTI